MRVHCFTDGYRILVEDFGSTAWELDDGRRVTLAQLLDVIGDLPVVDVPVGKVEDIIIKKSSGGIESGRLGVADVRYPIIIVVDDDGVFRYVLDGNHRANKAIDSGLKSIPARLVNIKALPPEMRVVFGG